jgi:beta-N-acetylhexosaminidase
MRAFGRSVAAVLLVLTVFCSLGGAETGTSGDRVEQLLKAMTLEAKAGQVLMGFFRGDSVTGPLRSMIDRVRPGGMILYSSTGNIISPKQTAELTLSLQEAAASSGTVPLFIAVDQEGGRVNRLTKGVTVFPGNMALGAAGDPELAAKAARVTAKELRTLGITVNFAPVADVLINPANPVIGTRSFGSDPALVARMASAMIEPTAQEGVLCVAKHFPGHGNTSVDSHFGLPVDPSPLETLRKVDRKSVV